MSVSHIEIVPIGKSTVSTEEVVTHIAVVDFGYGEVGGLPPSAGVGESALGIAWDLWTWDTPNKAWKKGGTLNPSGHPTNDIGIQFGLQVFATGQMKWLKGG